MRVRVPPRTRGWVLRLRVGFLNVQFFAGSWCLHLTSPRRQSRRGLVGSGSWPGGPPRKWHQPCGSVVLIHDIENGVRAQSVDTLDVLADDRRAARHFEPRFAPLTRTLRAPFRLST